MERKAQAAMEFLMTYGWAILAAIIAIGVLAYFGVFNPSRLSSGTAVLSAPLNIPAGSFNIVNDDVTNCGGNDCINIEVTQSVGQSIDVSSAVIALTSGGVGSCTVSVLDLVGLQDWQSGSSKTLHFDCSAATVFGSGDSVAGNIDIKYTSGASAIVQASTGNVRGVVQ